MGEAPTGTITFLFTDIEGSTRLWEATPEVMSTCLARHDELLRTVFARFGGWVFATGGDGFAVAFERAADALDAAGDVLEVLDREPWPPGVDIRVRIGIHTGEATERGGDYFGSAVNRTARLMALAHGGQALCSATTLAVVPTPPSTMDLGEHRLRDLMAPLRVHQLGTRTFPALRSDAPVTSNLPSRTTDLIGRADDLDALVAELGRHRMVTITGAGGMGKTRLAIEVAASAAAGFRDGVWFVDLVPTADSGDVVRAVAASIGATAAASSADALLTHLANRSTLLVLDNCEHVVDAVAELAAGLLTHAPDVSLLATSREPLGVAGESVRRLEPLGLPDGSTAGISAVRTSPAVRLFEERAAEARAGFVVDEDDVDGVVEICRRLDGVPLAIELAAARVGAMSVRDIRSHLGERFRLLAGTRRGHERHRTLRAAVGWSYDLLEPDDQRIFRSLSMLTGGFGLVDATAIVGGPDADAFEMLDAVTRLVDRSLVVHDGETGRYRLLESLRQYGTERLAAAGETDLVRDRFVAHYFALAAREGPRLPGPDCEQARDVLSDAIDCLRVTAEWLGSAGRLNELAAFMNSLWWYLSQEAPAEAGAWLQPLLDPDADAEPQALYDGLCTAARCALIAADVTTALELDRRLHQVVADNPEVQESAWTDHVSVSMAAYAPDAESADRCRSMVEDAERCGDQHAAVYARSISMLVLPSGDPDRIPTIERVVADAEALGGPLWIGVALALGITALFRDGVTRVAAERALTLIEDHPGWRGGGSVTEASCWLAAASAHTATDPPAAVLGVAECIRLADRTGQSNMVTNGLTVAVYAAALLGSHDIAARLHRHNLATTVWVNPHDAWVRGEIVRLLAEAGFGEGALTPQSMSRTEMFATLDELQERHPQQTAPQATTLS